MVVIAIVSLRDINMTSYFIKKKKLDFFNCIV